MTRPVFPVPVERRYRTFLHTRWRSWHAQLTKQLPPSRTDARAVEGARQAFTLPAPPRLRDLSPLAVQVDVWATDAIVREVQRLATIDVRGTAKRSLKDAHTAWVRTNIELITNAEADLLDRLAPMVEEAVAKGQTATELAKLISDRLSVALSRANTIARSEIGTLNSQISAARMQGAGFTHYEWSTSDDERVRPSHEALDGTVRAWSDPHPREGHPGHAVNCRCVALPVDAPEGPPEEAP